MPPLEKLSRTPPTLEFIPRSQIEPGKNIRESVNNEGIEELAASIRQHGILNPTRVRRLDEKKFVMVDGHRRLLAAEKAELKIIPCFVVENESDDTGRCTEQLVLNCVREGLTPVEIARGLLELKTAKGLTSAQVGELIGFGPDKVSRYLSFLDAPQHLQDLVESNQLPMTTALELARVDAAERDTLLPLALQGKLTRDQLAGARKQRQKPSSSDPAVNPARLTRATAALPGGRTITVVGQSLNLEGFIELLEELLTKARKVRPQGVELGTFIKMLRDQAVQAELSAFQ